MTAYDFGLVGRLLAIWRAGAPSRAILLNNLVTVDPLGGRL
jgi:hypothetical protein